VEKRREEEEREKEPVKEKEKEPVKEKEKGGRRR